MSHRKAPPVRHDDPTMAGQRSRDVTSGELRQKRADTRVDTLEKLYGVDLHRRGDMTLGVLREELGVNGLKDLIDKSRTE
jgi:hypothetical protein